VRENPERAEFIGYNPRTVRFLAFCLAGCFAGTAGALAAINFELVGVTTLTSAQSGMILLMTYVGGTTQFAGPILGAALVTYLQIKLSDVTDGWLMYLGLMFMLAVIYMPDGIAGWLTLHWIAVRRGHAVRLVPAYLLVCGPLCLLLLGGIMVVELAYHLFGASSGFAFSVHGIAIDSRNPVQWATAGFVTAAGLWLTERGWPRVRAAWSSLDVAG
jgi:branched-chain amino acid transport system permease protein